MRLPKHTFIYKLFDIQLLEYASTPTLREPCKTSESQKEKVQAVFAHTSITITYDTIGSESPHNLHALFLFVHTEFHSHGFPSNYPQ